MKNILLGALALGLAAFTAPVADAAPLIVSSSLNVWYASGFSGSSISDPREQALPTNPIRSIAGSLLYSGSYNGAIDFTQGGTGGGNILTFLQSAGSSPTGNTSSLNGHILSTGGFTDATLMSFTFTTGGSPISGLISHDDGISIALGGIGNNSVFVDSSTPTNSVATAFNLAANTQYTIWYAEVNGLPAELRTNVPEPASLALLGAGLVGVGAVRRRRAAAAAATN